jgi:hypothetical protein
MLSEGNDLLSRKSSPASGHSEERCNSGGHRQRGCLDRSPLVDRSCILPAVVLWSCWIVFLVELLFKLRLCSSNREWIPFLLSAEGTIDLQPRDLRKLQLCLAWATAFLFDGWRARPKIVLIVFLTLAVVGVFIVQHT